METSNEEKMLHVKPSLKPLVPNSAPWIRQPKSVFNISFCGADVQKNDNTNYLNAGRYLSLGSNSDHDDDYRVPTICSLYLNNTILEAIWVKSSICACIVAVYSVPGHWTRSQWEITLVNRGMFSSYYLPLILATEDDVQMWRRIIRVVVRCRLAEMKGASTMYILTGTRP